MNMLLICLLVFSKIVYIFMVSKFDLTLIIISIYCLGLAMHSTKAAVAACYNGLAGSQIVSTCTAPYNSYCMVYLEIIITICLIDFYLINVLEK